MSGLMQNLALVEKVDELAKAKGIKPGQLALAWVHAQALPSLLHRCSLDAHLILRLPDTGRRTSLKCLKPPQLQKQVQTQC